MKRLELTRDTVGTVARGHPWVYRDGVRGSAEVGDAVALVDHRGAFVAWGIFDRGTIAVRVLGRDPGAAGDVRACLRARVHAAWRRRAVVRQVTSAFRVVNGAGDALDGIVVDLYGAVAVVKLYASAWERWVDDLAAAVTEVSGASSVYRRLGVERVDGRSGGEIVLGPAPPEVLVVEEHGMKMLARVRDGQKTGLFLDQREHRRLVRGWSEGRTVVNLFSYSGGFSVAAALGRARRVTSVDASEGAIEDARENFRLNGIDPRGHEFVVGDAFAWSGGGGELVVVDPPSLSRDRSSDGAARAAYKKLHRHVASYARELVATSSCTARLSWERWEESVRDGLGAGWAQLHRSGEPADHPVALAHPEGRYLKFLLVGSWR
jgi:23S rRNA (cytosine1962-C5)-methyltransferase